MTEKLLQTKIISHLRDKGSATAREIARAIEVDKKDVNSALYGDLASSVEQDSSYRWSLRGDVKRSAASTALIETPLARLGRYYLDCLAHELPGVGVFAESRFELDYEVIKASQSLQENLDLTNSPLASRTRSDRNQILYLGYPCLITRARNKTGSWSGNFVEPLTLLPLMAGGDGRAAGDMIVLNQRALKTLTRASDALVLQEIVELSSELGLDAGTPDLEELVQRLQLVRPEWPWRERIDPDSRHQETFSDGTPEGIYNTAVLIAAERTPYTIGLEAELAQLTRLREDQYASTALGHWLRPEAGTAPVDPGVPQPLIEPVLLNDEQRVAVERALTQKLTLITGPPGTGKSQVVSAILANAAYRGKTVLFASKNNKAVDVVERRVNALGPRPSLIRLGGKTEHRDALIAFLASYLSARPSSNSKERFDDALRRLTSAQASSDSIRKSGEQLLALRNRVDALEQSVEAVRKKFGPDAFGLWLHSIPSKIEGEVDEITSAVRGALPASLPRVVRFLWFLVRRARWNRLTHVLSNSEPVLGRLMIRPPAEASDSMWSGFEREVRERFQGLRTVSEYGEALRQLDELPGAESLARQGREATDKKSEASTELWAEWLRLQPQRLTADRRRTLGDVHAALELKAADDDESSAARHFKKLQRDLFSSGDVLPCWAITSLAARGRLPLDGGIFDLVVIDEASQCDIASAIPLLFRARRAVIIGDPKQLRHIASLPEHQDRALLSKHDLIESRLSWCYSTRSLFDLATSLVRTEDIVDLLDHHRSHADIIDFANRVFYEDRLRIATRYDRLKTPTPDEPAIRWCDVSGQVKRPAEGGAVNESEARAVVAELRRLVVERAYSGTVGVVTPFKAQQLRIRDLAMADPELARRATAAELLIETVHLFQGDERDVMFMSPVISQGSPPGAMTFLRRNVNLFNVAITRARAALVIVGDRTACAASDVDYLVRLVEYVSSIEQRSSSLEPQPAELGRSYPHVARPEVVSEWERVLYIALYDAGLRPAPQYPVEKFALDFALFEGRAKLNIEVDGERYHRQWDGELMRRDRLRNERLFELGWDVMRFWVYQVRDDLDGCVSRVKKWSEVMRREGEGERR